MFKSLSVSVAIVLIAVAAAGAAGPELKTEDQKTLYALGLVDPHLQPAAHAVGVGDTAEHDQCLTRLSWPCQTACPAARRSAIPARPCLPNA